MPPAAQDHAVVWPPNAPYQLPCTLWQGLSRLIGFQLQPDIARCYIFGHDPVWQRDV